MSPQEVKNHITYLPEFQIVIYHLYEIYIPSKDPLQHYEQNHTSKKDHPIAMEVHRKIAEYMTTLDLCESHRIIFPRELIPQLKIIKNGWICNFPECDQYSISENDILTHYYTHQKYIPKDFKD